MTAERWVNIPLLIVAVLGAALLVPFIILVGALKLTRV
jgi:hypothetical protein